MRQRSVWQRWVQQSLAAALLVLAALLALQTVAAAEAWRQPVDAEVVDPFRPPATRFGPGNRGLEYGTVGGENVRAVDGGRVVFAGSVAGAVHVVVDHGEGLKSTYAFLRTAAVVRGQTVAKGQQIGTAAAGFHLTARLGGVYVDPRLLFLGAEVEVALVAGQGPQLPQQLPRELPNAEPLEAVADAVGDLGFSAQIDALAGATRAWYRTDCTADSANISPLDGSLPGEGRTLIQVGGLGSSSEEASIGGLDYQALGYADSDVVGFSYAGGCIARPFGSGESQIKGAGGEPSPSSYEADDTYQSIEVSAVRLADLVEGVAQARPGKPIDIAAHSLGGVVTRRALEILADRSPNGVPVDVVITIGSPHGGADLATTVAATPGDGLVGTALDYVLGDNSNLRDAQSVLELAEAGGFELAPPRPPPDGVRVVAVAGGTDLIVSAEQAIWDGAVNVLVPTSVVGPTRVHSELPARDEVEREFALALTGRAPRCVALGSVLASVAGGRFISASEDSITVVAGVLNWIL